MQPEVKDVLAAAFEAEAAAVIEERGRAPLRQRKKGSTRTLRTETGREVTHGQLVQSLLLREGVERPLIENAPRRKSQAVVDAINARARYIKAKSMVGKTMGTWRIKAHQAAFWPPEYRVKYVFHAICLSCARRVLRPLYKLKHPCPCIRSRGDMPPRVPAAE